MGWWTDAPPHPRLVHETLNRTTHVYAIKQCLSDASSTLASSTANVAQTPVEKRSGHVPGYQALEPDQEAPRKAQTKSTWLLTRRSRPWEVAIRISDPYDPPQRTPLFHPSPLTRPLEDQALRHTRLPTPVPPRTWSAAKRSHHQASPYAR